MATLEELPADQRAVLSLLMAQQKSYAEIAQALDLTESAVSERAYSALSSLAEPEKPPPNKRRAEIGDYLLGQVDDGAAAATRQSLTRSASDRAWARAAVGSLAELATEPLPVIPGAELSGGPNESGSATVSAASGDGSAGSRGGFFLIAGVVLLVALGVGFGVGRATDGGSSSGATSTTASGTTASSANATAIAQAALKPPAGSPAPKALGFAGISKQGNQRVLSVVAKSLPAAPKGSQYGVWLTSSGKPAVWLGYLQSVGSGGVGLQGTLNGDPKNYSGVSLTLEKASTTPTNPSKTYLVGALTFVGS
jgi:hypothetical protein